MKPKWWKIRFHSPLKTVSCETLTKDTRSGNDNDSFHKQQMILSTVLCIEWSRRLVLFRSTRKIRNIHFEWLSVCKATCCVSFRKVEICLIDACLKWFSCVHVKSRPQNWYFNHLSRVVSSTVISGCIKQGVCGCCCFFSS